MRTAGGAALGAAGGSDAAGRDRRHRRRRRLHAEERLRRRHVQIRLLITTHSHQNVHVRPVADRVAFRPRRRRRR